MANKSKHLLKLKRAVKKLSTTQPGLLEIAQTFSHAMKNNSKITLHKKHPNLHHRVASRKYLKRAPPPKRTTRRTTASRAKSKKMKNNSKITLHKKHPHLHHSAASRKYLKRATPPQRTTRRTTAARAKSKKMEYKEVVNISLKNDTDSLYYVMWLVYFYEAVYRYGGEHIYKYMEDSSANENFALPQSDRGCLKIDNIEYPKFLLIAEFSNNTLQWDPWYLSRIRETLEDAGSPITKRFSIAPHALEMFVNIFANKTVFANCNGLDLDVARLFVIFSLLNFNSTSLLENSMLYEIADTEHHFAWFMVLDKKVETNLQFNMKNILDTFYIGSNRHKQYLFDIPHPYYYESFLGVIENNDVFTYTGQENTFGKYLSHLIQTDSDLLEKKEKLDGVEFEDSKVSKVDELFDKAFSLEVEKKQVVAIYDYALRIYRYFIGINNNTKAQECLKNTIPSLNKDEIPIIQKILKTYIKTSDIFILKKKTKLGMNKKNFVNVYNLFSKQEKVFAMIKMLLNFPYEFLED